MSSSVPDVIKVIDKRLERALPIFMDKMKAAVEESVETATEKFYSDYPTEFNRDGDLSEIVDVSILGSGLNNTAIKLDLSDMEKPSWHYEIINGVTQLVEGYPENIYESVFKEGYHGGRGKSHTLWGVATATQTEAPFDIMIREIRKYANGQAQADFETAYNSAN